MHAMTVLLKFLLNKVRRLRSLLCAEALQCVSFTHQLDEKGPKPVDSGPAQLLLVVAILIYGRATLKCQLLRATEPCESRATTLTVCSPAERSVRGI